MEEKFALEFTKQQWYDLLDAVRSSEFGSAPDECIEKIEKLLCPNDHVEDVLIDQTTGPRMVIYNWQPTIIRVSCYCSRCGRYLWGVQTWNTDTYRYTTYEGYVEFKLGDDAQDLEFTYWPRFQ